MVKFKEKLPNEPGIYKHRYIDPKGVMQEQTLFVGYTNANFNRLQGVEPTPFARRKLRCCRRDEHLHADRLTPTEWGGWWSERLKPQGGEEA